MVRIKKNKHGYVFKYKILLVSLFNEEGFGLVDCLYTDTNIDLNTLHIYAKLRYDGKDILSFPICFDFTDTKCEEAVKSRMRKIMEKTPNISQRELGILTGHCSASITRHYMTLKRELLTK